MATDYPSPGRGAWTVTGGLLPGKPGTVTKTGYYRLAVDGPPGSAIGREVPVGSRPTQGHPYYCVTRAVMAIQELAGMGATADTSSDIDGWFGSDTDRAVRALQQRLGVEADGIVGRTTMRAALAEMVHDIAVHNQVPEKLLGGLAVNESGLDPAAVGTNGQDHGVVQINLAVHGALITLEEALDPFFSLSWAALDMREKYEQWAGKTVGGVDPWWIAVANHNSPKLARQWASTGRPPVVEGRTVQIYDYVQRVREAWTPSS